jgi:hypothetical protein
MSITITLINFSFISYILCKLEGNILIFFYSCVSRLKFFRSWLHNINLRVPSANVKNFSQFSVSRKDFPFSRCATAANLVCIGMNVFSTKLDL